MKKISAKGKLETRERGDRIVKKEWSTGKIVGVVTGSIAAAFILLAAFAGSVFFLNTAVTVLYKNEAEAESDYEEASQRKKDKERKEESFEEDFEEDFLKENDNKDFYDKDSDASGEYYEFGNAVLDNLSYRITFEESERTEFENVKGDVAVHFSYPVISGENVLNLNGINAAVQKEIAYVEESLSKNLVYQGEEESYYFEGDCYVTYMSEEILSLAYVEYGYQNGSYAESYVVPINIDMRSGMLLDNTELLDIDDDFSIDFRKRSEKQNGEMEELSYFSDQDITDYLTDKDSLIIFYTPLGMEVGLNFYGGWVTVTYRDYEKYQKQF